MADNIDLNGHILEDVEDASKSQGTPTLSDVLLALTISESGASVQELKHYSVSDLITALGKVATDAEAGAVEALEDAEGILKSCQDALAAIGNSNTTGLRGEAIEALETALSTALESISSAKASALSAIGESDTAGARGDAISAIGNAKDEALSDISTAKTNALTAIGEDNESGARGDAIEALKQKASELSVAPWIPYPSFNIRYDQEEGTALVRLTNDYAGIGDVAMRYTINGMVPTINSAVFPAEGLVVGWNCTIKVRAFPPAGSTDLAPSVTNETYVEDLAVSEPFTPILSIQPGTAIDNCRISVTNHEAIDGMDGELRHTTDGTDPTATDTLSDGDFEISDNCTVKVKAFYLGGAESPVASIAVSDLKAQAPSIAIISDSPSESSTVVVLVSMTPATDGSVIHYSTDGSNPTVEDTEYQEIAEITPPATVKAIATKGNLLASDITSLSIPEMTMCAAPTITYDPYAQTVTIASATSSATIHYTTDGSVPTTASPVYSTALMVTENMTIKAFAVAEGYVNSTLSTEEIVYITQLEVPEISFSANTVTIVGPSGAGIHYTTDGSIPTEDDPLYSAPFAWYQNATIKAIAIADGYLDSEVASLSVSVTLPTPTLSRTAGTVIDNCTVSISNMAGYGNYGTVTFRYTTDGSEPSETSTILSGSAAITANGTIKAKAFSTTANASATGSITIADLKAQTPTITVGDDSYSATMATATSGASIRYTLDGTEPTEASLLYSGEIEVSPPVTIKAKSLKNGLIASDTIEQFVAVPADIVGYGTDTVGYYGDELGYEIGA